MRSVAPMRAAVVFEVYQPMLPNEARRAFAPAPVGHAVAAAATALLAVPASAQDMSEPTPAEILVIGERHVDSDVPTADEMARRFLLRPGAESIVSQEMLAERRVSGLQDVFDFTPGIFATSRDQGTGGILSIRGSDIATEGPRNGRGVRGYIDGVPLGRTEAGLTAPLIDMLAAAHVEVYRGGSSLRYGSLSSGGSINFVSKTGINHPGTGVRFMGGSFDFLQGQFEHGARSGAIDYYVSLSGQHFDGYREQSAGSNARLTSNLGWQVAPHIRTRFYLTVGSTHQQLPSAIPLDQIDTLRRTSDALSTRFDTDANFDLYVRAANRTQIDMGSAGMLEFSGFVLHTHFDHLPTPFSGLVDNRWREGGLGVRWEHSTDAIGLPAEIVLGGRYTHTDGDFKRWQHRDGGRQRGALVLDNDFTAEILEGYGEAALTFAPAFRGFLGFQAVHTTRAIVDRFTGSVPSVPITSPGGPQPGSIPGDQSSKVSFRDFVPKVGVNWEWRPGNALFANVTRAFEAPTGSDVENVINLGARFPGSELTPIDAQRATTLEAGLRGRLGVLRYDLTAYRSIVDAEILTRCATEISATCSETVAFNAGRTLHRGFEFGGDLILADDVLAHGARLAIDVTGAVQDFRFDGDPLFGDNRLPNVPRFFGTASLRWGGDAGPYARGSVRHTGNRTTTYDGSGGEAFVVPAVTTYGLTIGWRGERFDLFVEGRNLTDEAYAADFSATPSVPLVRAGPALVPATSASVRPGDGRAVYAGVRFGF